MWCNVMQLLLELCMVLLGEAGASVPRCMVAIPMPMLCVLIKWRTKPKIGTNQVTSLVWRVFSTVRFCGCLHNLHLFACLLCFLSAYICPHLAPISLLHLFVVYQQSGIQSRHLIFGILVSLVWNIFRGHARSSQAGTAGIFTKPTRSSQQFAKEGYFFWHFCFFGIFFFFASGFWLLASGFLGFWLLACICCILEPTSVICVLFAAVWSQFACLFGFWLLALASLDSWLLVFVLCCFFFWLWFHLAFFVLAALLLNVCVVL